MKTLGGLFAFLTMLVLIVAAGVGYVRYQHTQPGPSTDDTVILIPRGVGPTSIADRLVSAGVIENTQFFLINVRANGHSGSLRAGEYLFPAGISPSEAVDILREGRSIAYQITIPEGLTSREVVDILNADDRLTGEIETTPPQGALLPETYAFVRGDSRQDVMDRMTGAMNDVLAELWEGRAPDLPITSPAEAVTLASIVEKETGVDGERGLVAGVFINRLNIGMKLQSDPTTIFALTNGERELGRELLRSDWTVESPYNTYYIEGLPPGPIANPGRAALEAVLSPAETEYFYFVADGTGGHAFARTLEEHNRNVAEWRRVRDQ